MDNHEFVKGFPNNFKDLPIRIIRQKHNLSDVFNGGDLETFYGLTENSEWYRVYHATVDIKLPGIAQQGLKAFFEKKQDSPRIFVTPSPTLALWHALENRPHDTLRKLGALPESVATGKPVLLQLQIDKKWLSEQKDLGKPLDPTEFIRLLGEEDIIGARTSGQLTRLQTFHSFLQVEVDELKEGKEATNLGIQLPVDHIPPEYIFVDTFTSTVPIRKWVEARK